MKTYEEIYDAHEGDVAAITAEMETELKESGVGFNAMMLLVAELSGLKYAVRELQIQLVNVGIAAEVLPDGFDDSVRALDEGFTFAMQRGTYDVAYSAWQENKARIVKPDSGLVVPS